MFRLVLTLLSLLLLFFVLEFAFDQEKAMERLGRLVAAFRRGAQGQAHSEDNKRLP